MEAAVQSLHRAAMAVAQPGGPDLFAQLVEQLAESLGVAVAFVAVFEDESRTRMRTLAARLDGKPLRNFGYALEGSPCQQVVGNRFRHVGRGVAAEFAQGTLFAAKGMDSYAAYPLNDSAGTPLGLLAAIDREPIADAALAEALLKIFAVRMVAEIERGVADEALRTAALAVSSARGETVFDELTRYLATILHVDVAMIALLDGEPATHLDAIALQLDGRSIPHWRYAIDGTPCKEVLAGGFRAYASHVDELFAGTDTASLGLQSYAGYPLADHDGRTFGLVAVAARRPLANLERIEPMLQIFAVRAGAEIQRQRAEEALRLREDQYRAVFDGSTDALILWSSELRIVDVNPAFTQLYGYSRDEMVGDDFGERLPREEVARRLALIARALQGEESQIETTTYGKRGAFEVELRYLPIVHRGEPHVLCVARDITARRRAEAERSELEAQLRQAQKMEAIGQLTGGIAHDFNNILTSVIGYVVLATERAQAGGDARLVRQLGQAQLAAQRARDLIAQMLTFARRQRSERHVLSPAPLVRQAVQLLRATLPASIELDNLQADAEPEEASSPIEADAVQLEQVLFNLCINARDAIDGSGQIRVRVQDAPGGNWHCASCRSRIDGGRWVQISVADSGSGIAPDVLERMFDPFYSTKPASHGSGMGLAMAHGIVHDHGGHIRVETRPGAGSTFHVMLPPAATVAPVSLASAVPGRRAAPAPMQGRVLLVEDQPLVGDFMTELLESWGLEVVLHRDPLAAQRCLADATQPLQLMITDQTMPQLTGLELARRAAGLRPALPVLLYTGGADIFDALALQGTGVQAVLRKPIAPEGLRVLVRRVLQTPLAMPCASGHGHSESSGLDGAAV